VDGLEKQTQFKYAVAVYTAWRLNRQVLNPPLEMLACWNRSPLWKTSAVLSYDTEQPAPIFSCRDSCCLFLNRYIFVVVVTFFKCITISKVKGGRQKEGQVKRSIS